MAKKKQRTALDFCARHASASGYRGSVFKNFIKRCVREVTAQRRAGNGLGSGGGRWLWRFANGKWHDVPDAADVTGPEAIKKYKRLQRAGTPGGRLVMTVSPNRPTHTPADDDEG